MSATNRFVVLHEAGWDKLRRVWSRALGRCRTGAIVLLLSLTASHGALAQPPAAAQAARDHKHAGHAYAERGKWEEALREYEEAFTLDQQPATLFNIANLRFKLRRYCGARDAYRTVLRSRAELEAPAQKALDENLPLAESRIVHVDISGAEGQDVVEVDGVRVDFTHLVDVDPGVHEVVLVRDARRLLVRQVTAEEGRPLSVSLRLAPLAPSTPPPSGPAPDGMPPVGHRPVTGFVVGGFGVVALGVGAGIGVSALSRRSELADTCGKTHTCTKSDTDSARTRMAVADVTLGVGILATAIGVYLLAKRPSTSVTVQAGPAVGGAYASLGTSFD